MKPLAHPHIRRRFRLVNPRLQAGVAGQIGAFVLVAGGLTAFLLYRDLRQALWVASYSGHFDFPSSYRLLKNILIGRLVLLFAVVFAGGAVMFFWYVRRIRKGIFHLVEVLKDSATGDLSTPVKARGPAGLLDFATGIDEVRSFTFGLIEEVRTEVDSLRTSALPDEEFDRRWGELKGRIGRIVP